MKVILFGGGPGFATPQILGSMVAFPHETTRSFGKLLTLLAVLVTWARLAMTHCSWGKYKHLEGMCLPVLQNTITSISA